MIDCEEIEAQAERLGIHTAHVERDYVFGWLLKLSLTDLAMRLSARKLSVLPLDNRAILSMRRRFKTEFLAMRLVCQMRIAMITMCLLGSIAFPPAAQARTTGSDLLAWCKGQSELLGQTTDQAAEVYYKGVCQGFVRSLFELSPVVESPVRSCPPRNLTYGQAEDIVVRFLSGNPSRRHEAAIGLVLSSFNS